MTDWGAAHEVGRLVDAAGAPVLRNLRERTERTAAIELAVSPVRRDDGRRSLALLTPLLERRERVEHVRSLAAAAMRHARREEEAHRIIHLRLAERLHHVLVVGDR